MNHNEFIKILQQKENEINQLINSILPRKVGKMAVDHFRDNFYKQGFVDNGLNPWKMPKRYDVDGKYASSKYGALLSARNELFNSITFSIVNGTIIISSDKEYAQIHNDGGTTHPTVTEKMKKFAWFKHYQTKQKDSMWKGIALKKTNSKLNVNIPKRQFIGESAELENKIANLIEKEIEKLFK